MRKLVLFLIDLFLVMALVACKEGGGGASFSPSDPGLIPPGSSVKTITVKSGRDFSCFIYNDSSGSVFCKGTNPELTDIWETQALNSPVYVRIASNAQAFSDLETWDDTVCMTTTVSQRPHSGTPGTATYCIGEPNLGVGYSAWPIIHSGPFFSLAHVSAGLSFAILPFMGGDIVMAQITNEFYMLDGRGLTGSQTINCILSNGQLVCPGFTVNVN